MTNPIILKTFLSENDSPYYSQIIKEVMVYSTANKFP